MYLFLIFKHLIIENKSLEINDLKKQTKNFKHENNELNKKLNKYEEISQSDNIKIKDHENLIEKL